MAWQSIVFSLPNGISSISDDADSLLDSIASDGSAASARLLAADKPTYTKNSLAATAAGIEHDVNALAQKDITVMYAHPWVNGLYQQGPIRGFLSARNAVKSCAAKLPDLFDGHAIKGNIEVLVLLFSAGNYSQLAEALLAFNAVFYLPELAMLERRCEQLADHEKTRLVIPESAIYPLYLQRSTQQFSLVKVSSDLLHGKMAMVSAYDDQNITPADELEALINEKNDYVVSLQDAYAVFSATFSGGSGSALFLPEGSAFSRGQLLRQEADSLPEKPLSVAVMMSGASGSLALVKAAVGL